MRILEDIQTKLALVKERIGQHIHHPYLIQYIRNPVIDEDKLLLLMLILEQQQLTESEIENYSLTTMLVQLALDTHEQVSNEDYSDQDYHLEKERQLTVLGGIYYSSLYYKLLAQMENIGLTRALSIGIKEINEHKIFVYQENTSNVDLLMKSMKKIECALFDKITDYFQASGWQTIVENILFIKRMFTERQTFLEKKRSVLFESLQRCLLSQEKNKQSTLTVDQQHYLLDVCDRYVNHSILTLESNLHKLPTANRLLEQRISEMIEQYPSKGKTFVGEG